MNQFILVFYANFNSKAMFMNCVQKMQFFQLRDMHDTSVHSTTALSLPDQTGHSTQASYTILNSQTLQILRFR